MYDDGPIVMIVAGEASGDLLGADLMREMKKKRPDLNFIGVGGSAMQEEGLENVFSIDELSVMGISDVVPQIPNLFKRMGELVQVAVSKQVVALVTIDSQDFSKRLARRLKTFCNIPCIHYVCPTVWAWRKKRVYEYAKVFDHILALFPFEPPYFEKVGLECTFVGHPVVARLKEYVPKTVRAPVKLRLALLPGSRKGEILRHWPVMKEVFLVLKKDIPDLEGIVAVTDDSVLEYIEPAEGISFVAGNNRFSALSKCKAAFTKSGTMNLELAAMGVPMVVGYTTTALNYFIARLLVKVPYISPVNWVAGKTIVPELIQKDMTKAVVVPMLESLLVGKEVWNQQAKELKKVRDSLHIEKASEKAAEVVLKYIPERG